MRSCRRPTATLVVLLVCTCVPVPAAVAQTVPDPNALPPVSTVPQDEEPPEGAPPLVPEDEEQGAEEDDGLSAEELEGSGSGSEDDDETSADEATTSLPNTGADARMVGLLGATVLLAGVGLRLRTVPERF